MTPAIPGPISGLQAAMPSAPPMMPPMEADATPFQTDDPPSDGTLMGRLWAGDHPPFAHSLRASLPLAHGAFTLSNFLAALTT